MSSCELDLRLEKSDATFRPGESIRGEVRVRVDERVECRGLMVTVQWTTHGRGNRRQGQAGDFLIFQREWLPGRDYTYPFDLRTPPGPATYHGNVLNVDHYLTVRADIPWSMDP